MLGGSQRLASAKALMRTPLQVTFMATLVTAGGRPPRDRWKLFRDYYDTIYKREQQKAEGELRGVLDNHDTLIHRVHHDVGFLLQVHGENAGATDAMMPLEDFKKLVTRYLSDDGWDQPDIDRIKAQIVDEARTRLVFLTSRVAEKISFDVRSLQEHMAAECIMTGAQVVLYRRLSVIAPLPYWRNVLLFAAGQCFAVPQLQHLRPSIKQLCDDMNDEEADSALALTYAGSRLALDLLEDGTVSNTPTFARAFAKLALDVLNASSFDHHYESRPPVQVRIARAYEQRLDGVYRDKLLARIADPKRVNTKAWGTLIILIGRGVGWASELADRYWPVDVEAQALILSGNEGGSAYPSEWVTARLINLVPRIKPNRISGVEALSAAKNPPDWLRVAMVRDYYGHEKPTVAVRITEMPKGLVRLTFQSVFASERSYSAQLIKLKEMPMSCPEWLPHIAGARLLSAPTKETLAEQLIEIYSNCSMESIKGIRRLPWPLQACLEAAEKLADLRLFATRASEGELGDTEVWAAAEKRWTERGIALEEIKKIPIEHAPFGKEIVDTGFPCVLWFELITAQGPLNLISASLFDIIQRYDDLTIRKFLRHCIQSNILRSGRFNLEHPAVPLAKWRAVFGGEALLPLGLGLLVSFIWPDKLDRDWIEYFDDLGRGGSELGGYHSRSRESNLAKLLEDVYIAEPNRVGIMRLLGWFLLDEYQFSIPEILLRTERFGDNRMKLAAIGIRIKAGFGGDMILLAEEILNLERADPKLSAISLALRAVGISREPIGSLERFVLKLRGGSAEAEENSMAKCDQALLSLVRRRNSGLSERERAEELGLPWGEIAKTTKR